MGKIYERLYNISSKKMMEIYYYGTDAQVASVRDSR